MISSIISNASGQSKFIALFLIWETRINIKYGKRYDGSYRFIS